MAAASAALRARVVRVCAPSGGACAARLTEARLALGPGLRTPTRNLCARSALRPSLRGGGGRTDAVRRWAGDAGSAAGQGESKYPGAPEARFTDQLRVQLDTSVAPIFRLMDNQGRLQRSDYKLPLSKEQLLRMYETMVTVNTMDTVFYDAQRQGRISFYMTSWGEEAAAIGSAQALQPEDTIFTQYREVGVFLVRGFTLHEVAQQLFSTQFDYGKGRQMPMHFGKASINMQTISSPLSTQIPQASGAAYAYKLAKKNAVVACYFGDGAASEGDFHAALNMAATLECPVIFFCRNNGYAISTPTKEQYRGDGIVSRAAGYGMHGIRVDGNDLLAVYEATAEARRIALGNRPVLIESMTYRGGHHSTSDDSSRYRSASEIQYWKEHNNPLSRARLFLESRGWWSTAQETELRDKVRASVMQELLNSEREFKPAASELFTDVYDTLPPHLREQQAALQAHLHEFADKYDLSHFAPEPKKPE
jgi:2-oxoisovalerate dehydrogenase E1 component alpha subunit